ncbi:aspartyl protease family protein, partial [Escherichia coli]|uniref:aspartyl protease family protein n=1 Tax=Escherichia coli TaxID=562 RepID=UPI0034D409CC
MFDTGATHSLVSENFAERLKVECWSLRDALVVSTPTGESVAITGEYRECPLMIGDRIREVNLFPIRMYDFDIILGMDWL